MPVVHVPAGVPRDTTGFRSSGQSPGHSQGQPSRGARATVHLIGGDAVAQAFLARVVDEPVTVIAVSDADATVFDRRGVPAGSLLRHCSEGNELSSWPRAERIAPAVAVPLVAADVVVVADEAEAESAAIANAVLVAAARGARLVLRSPHAVVALLAVGADESLLGRLGIDAALRGIGAALLRERDELRARCHSIALVAEAASDHELVAAASAIARIVFGATAASVGGVHGSRGDSRRVARVSRSGALSVAHEPAEPGSALAAPADRIVAVLELDDGQVRVHTGTAVGTERVAAAIVADVRRALAAEVQR